MIKPNNYEHICHVFKSFQVRASFPTRINYNHTQNRRSTHCNERKVAKVLHVRHVARFMQALINEAPIVYKCGSFEEVLEYLS